MTSCIDLERFLDGEVAREADTPEVMGESASEEGHEEHRNLGSTAIDLGGVLDHDTGEVPIERPSRDTSVPITSKRYVNASVASLKQLRKGLEKLTSVHSAEARSIVREWIDYRDQTSNEEDDTPEMNPSDLLEGDSPDTNPSGGSLDDQGVSWRV